MFEQGDPVLGQRLPRDRPGGGLDFGTPEGELLQEFPGGRGHLDTSAAAAADSVEIEAEPGEPVALSLEPLGRLHGQKRVELAYERALPLEPIQELVVQIPDRRPPSPEFGAGLSAGSRY